MLGRYADQFFAKQGNERILAHAPNGLAATPAYRDRGDRGTGVNAVVTGQFEMPGPQRQVSANQVVHQAAMLPGMGQMDMLPGMGQFNRDMLPGMGQMNMLPGMGDTVSQVSTIGMALLVGGALAVGLDMATRALQPAPAPARRRRTSKRRGRRTRR